MYQVTYLFQDAEVGYGEGESLEWTRAEARESVPAIYRGLDLDESLVECES